MPSKRTVRDLLFDLVLEAYTQGVAGKLFLTKDKVDDCLSQLAEVVRRLKKRKPKLTIVGLEKILDSGKSKFYIKPDGSIVAGTKKKDAYLEESIEGYNQAISDVLNLLKSEYESEAER